MNKSYRILNIFMELDRGGAETFVMNIYRNIDRKKIQFDFLVHGEKRGAYEDEIEAMGGRIFRLPKMSLLSLNKYNRAIDVFFTTHNEYKVVHSHASELGCFIFKKAKQYNIPFRVCHAHSAPNGLNIKTPVRYMFKKYIDCFSNARFSCSEAAGVWQYGENAEFEVINNGIETKKYTFNEDTRLDMRRQCDIDDSQLVVGHIGRFETPKNHKFILEIFEQIKLKKREAKLLFIGIGSLKEEIKSLVIEKGLEDSVLFVGAINNVPDYLQMMDVFVFPSLFEGLGIALIEAQASGLKCIASSTVPREANVTELVTNLDLTLSAEKWADTVISQTEVLDRTVYSAKVADAGYDILESALRLQDFYLKCYVGQQE
ncbi:MAG: glycosyltransferase family 1 protein [Ruminococcus sp.]|nr:glycosyltransferase family 1 protein [Ruminococcus sp.]